MRCIHSEMMVIFSDNSETHQICCTRPSVSRHLQQNYRVAEMGGALWRSSSPSPAQSEISYSRLLRIMPRWVLSISKKGNFTFLPFFFQCSNIFPPRGISMRSYHSSSQLSILFLFTSLFSFCLCGFDLLGFFKIVLGFLIFF